MHILLLLLLAAAPVSPSRGSTVFITQAPSNLVLEGTSNLHRWRCRGTTIQARLEVGATLQEINAAIDRIVAGAAVSFEGLPRPVFHLAVPVTSFRCGNRLMERDMIRALRGDEHPSIEFAFRALVGTVRYEELGERHTVTIAGELTVAGERRDATITIDGWRMAPDVFFVRASVPMRMSDFGIRPPTALFGLIRARDQIFAHFGLRLSVRPDDAE